MKIAFYAPLKSPNHTVPSGDRLMARLLIEALERGGHTVTVASELRSFSSDPAGKERERTDREADAEVERLSQLWSLEGTPDAWFCYHPYYKAPDLIGPQLARRFRLAYLTAEASYSRRRNQGIWARNQDHLIEAVRAAAVNICFTRRDRDGLLEGVPDGRYVLLRPFIDPAPFLAKEPRPQPGRFATVAMMRAGDKMESYRMLAAALAHLPHVPWTLSVVGDGPLREEVTSLFAALPSERITWHGQRSTKEVAEILRQSWAYAWPGTGEAYGLAYLEAQAVGLPVAAQAVAGVPEVVRHGVTGLLTPAGDVGAYAAALERLLTESGERDRMADAARRFVTEDCSIEGAAQRLNDILHQHLGARA